ncbi:MAG: protein kinase [Zavarzinella sp.]|nr:protein kinase [Zavarzinella sp.]
MPTANPCPDPGHWGDLLDSRLPEPVASTLTSHLEACPGCQSTLERLTAGEPTWVEAARAFEERPRPALRRAMEQLKAQGEAGLDTAGPSTIRDATVPFLRPPAGPDHLGRLGPYDVISVVGRGGMGVVLKAFDPALRRNVAIKVLAPQWASHAQARQRFTREAQTAAQVRHENVIAIHKVEEADGLPYLVMEYVPGVSLQQRLDRDGPLPVEDILRIGAQAAAGLAAAHAQDLIHRDVKPANILLDKDGNVRLTDFGLARAVDDTSLTQTGVIAGTPQYMAPEQARGAPLDHRADLFSLGSVLYAMCTGRSPFRGPSTVVVLKRVCEDTPRDVRDHNPDIPDWLAEIIDKLHAKKPRDRFQTADEVGRLLTRHLRHLRAPDKYEKPGPVAQPRPAAAWGLWLAALAVPAGAVVGLLIWGAVSVFGPQRDANSAPETKGQAPQAQAPQGQDPQSQGLQGRATQSPPAPRPVPPIGGDAYFQSVWADLHSDDLRTRMTAVDHFTTMQPNDQRATVIPRLVELTGEENPFIRRPAIKALRAWGTKDEVPVLMRLLNHKDPFTRSEALKAIGHFRDPRTLEPVIQCFRDNSTRRDARDALREMGPMAEPPLIDILNEPPHVFIVGLKKEAIDLLGEIGTEKSVPTLQKLLASRDFHEKASLPEAIQKALAAINLREKR